MVFKSPFSQKKAYDDDAGKYMVTYGHGHSQIYVSGHWPLEA